MEDKTERIVVHIENETENEITDVDFFNSNEDRVKINISIENKIESENKIVSLTWHEFNVNRCPCEKETLESLKFMSNLHDQSEEFSPNIDPHQDQKGVFLLRGSKQVMPLKPSFILRNLPAKSQITAIFYCDSL